MTAHILHQAGIPVGALSTAFLRVRETIEWNTTQKTSPSPFLIQKFLRRLQRAGCTHAVLEASSHGIVQGRLGYTWPLVAAITNTTPEHLDYHGTLEQYRRDKGKLLSMLREKGMAVLNADDRGFDLFRHMCQRHILTTSVQTDADLRVREITVISTGTQSTIVDRETSEILPLVLGIPGTFNVENALTAIACAKAVGVSPTQSVGALASFCGVPGRMERMDEGKPFAVYVDFTVTPAAYEKTLTILRTMVEPGKRILVLTGSCGDRMREKRPVVGAICSRLADVVVVANEDPYTEDPQKIIDEVWAGVDTSRCEAHRIFDRREAIRFLLSRARPGDAVILCAKGSDTTMMTAEGQIPWNEREIVRELLREIKKHDP
jgi:UDP-N-acetylmuramoyl-L-alanyl-D-glutamate--2,6-diaminopimelate ligase